MNSKCCPGDYKKKTVSDPFKVTPIDSLAVGSFPLDRMVVTENTNATKPKTPFGDTHCL